MIIYLRYATDSQTRKLPPFVDSGDGDSEETGLTIANTDILIGKPGGTTLTAKHSGGATHISNGIYYATFDSSDSDTVGNGELYIHKAGALYAFATLIVLPAKVYDSLFLGSDNLEVDIVQLLGTAWLTPAVAGTPDVNAKTVADKAGFSLSVTPPTASEVADAVLDEAKGEHAGFLATLFPAASYTAPPSASTVASQVRTELAAELARIDAAISTRLAAAGYTAPANADIATLLTRLSAARAGYLDLLNTYLDANVSGVVTEDAIAARIIEDHGAGAYGSGVGLQLKEYTLTQDGTPIAGVGCWVTSDAAGLIRISPVRQTNSLGKVVFQLDVPVGTTVYIWYQGATTGDAEVV
jgi:hypothetical protein